MYETILDMVSGDKRIAIVGRPRVGKTTLAEKLARDLGMLAIHTDIYMSRATFKEVPEVVMSEIKGREGFVIEGIQVSRMLKRGFEPNSVIVLSSDEEIDKKHKSLASMTDNSIAKWLESGPSANVYYIAKEELKY